MAYRTSPSRECSTCSGGTVPLQAVVVIMVVVMSVVPTVVVWTKTSLECEPDELGFALELERSVDDELPDIAKTLVNRQYAAWVWVLRDRSGEDARRELGREVGEGRHGENRVSSSVWRVTGGEAAIVGNEKSRHTQGCPDLTPSISIRFKAGEPSGGNPFRKLCRISQSLSKTTTMSSTTASTTPVTPPTDNTVQKRVTLEECITCRIIGTGALAGVGFYALQMSRPKAPGSVVGKRIMGGLGVCESLEPRHVTRSCSPVRSRSQVSFSQASSDGTGGRSKSFVNILLTFYASATATLQ